MLLFPEAAKILGTKPEFEKNFPILGASIDTRKVEPGNLFVAIQGARDDGHRFLEDAFRKGASGALVQREYFNAHKSSLDPALFKNLLPVENTCQAFAVLAAGWRSRLSLKAVGITGSVGKTSTKEFLSYFLRQKLKVLSTEGNFNNELGLPLTLFRLREDHQVCVAELGASHIGDIRFLTSLLKPTHAILTQVSPVHVEGFGSLQAIYDAKLEIVESLAAGSVAVLPDHDPVLLEKAGHFPAKIILAGQTPQADYFLSEVECEDSRVSFKVNGRQFSFPGLAAFLAKNAAMAIAMAEQIGVPMENLPSEWDDFKLPAGRFQEQSFNGLRIIFDGYNASPASFEAALESFCELKTTGRKILVFADMLELGPDERMYHEELGIKIAKCDFDLIVGYGLRAQVSVAATRDENDAVSAEHFPCAQGAAQFLKDQVREGDTILFKASRGMKIEEVLEELKQKDAKVYVPR